MEALTIYNVPPMAPRWDRVGIFYISFCATWTTLVAAGMAFCWVNRYSPILRVRGLSMSFAAIIFLHAYWILGQITYPVGVAMSPLLAYSIQYFFMGIYFPLGIALFQASNARFLYIARLQKQLVETGSWKRVVDEGCDGAHSSWLCRVRNLPHMTKVMAAIGFGMVIQVLLTTAMWLACKKYHPTFGIPGTEIKGGTLPEQLIDLGRGWEWWPSVLWQVIWTWIVAPILLWRAWGIRDTIGWRTQTIGCCIFSLHATPMFMISTYVPAFYPLNNYYHPSQWIHLSVMMFEIFTVFLPVVQVIRRQMAHKKAVDSNAKWITTSATRATSSTITSSEIRQAPEKSEKEDIPSGGRLITMGALEHVLAENPGPLQDFSALSDFSGENIAFLTRTAEWKAAHPASDMSHTSFNEALEIYVDFVSPRDAQFPLNLSSHTLGDLEMVLEKPARVLYGESPADPPVTPFDMETGIDFGSRDSLRAKYTGEIPVDFSPQVFDAAIEHVKYLVLTNTWPKFVSAMERRRSEESQRTTETSMSGTTVGSQLSKLSSIIRLKWMR